MEQPPSCSLVLTKGTQLLSRGTAAHCWDVVLQHKHTCASLGPGRQRGQKKLSFHCLPPKPSGGNFTNTVGLTTISIDGFS